MKNLIRLLAGLCATSTAAAADLTLKDQSVYPKTARMAAVSEPVNTCTLVMCSGFYVGVDLTGLGTNVDLNNGASKLFAGGTMLGGHAGYQLWNGTYFAAVEAGCAFETANNLNVTGSGGLRHKYLCTELVKLGAGLNGLFGASATPSTAPSQGPTPINIPASIAHMLAAPYVTAGAAQRLGKTGTAVGAGAEFILAQGWNLSLEYLRITYPGKGPVISPDEAIDNENLIRLTLNRKF